MATPFKVIFDGVLSKWRSTGISDVTEEELDEILFDYIRPACVRFRACKQNLNLRSDALGTLGSFDVELTHEEIEILINFVYLEFLTTNFISVPSLLRQSLVSRDYHTFSARNHLDGLIKLRDTIQAETRQMISAYSNTDSDLFERLRARRAGSGV